MFALPLLVQVYYRVEWAKFQERERKKEEEEKEKERVAYAQIDWHDFVVVETVDFQPSEQGTGIQCCDLSDMLLPFSRETPFLDSRGVLQLCICQREKGKPPSDSVQGWVFL